MITHFLIVLERKSGEDCDTCGPKVTSADDVKDMDMPEWKKKALASGENLDASAAPFGMSWGTESTTTATEAHKKQKIAEDDA